MLRSVLVVLLVGCGGAPKVSYEVRPAGGDKAALKGAVEAFFTAPDAAGLRAAVAQAQAAGSASAAYHDIAAHLAELEGRRADVVAHLIAALQDRDAQTPGDLLQRLARTSWTIPERRRVEALLKALAAQHPQLELRAFAAWMHSFALHRAGAKASQRAALAEVGLRPQLAIIGPWDNDQGKAFDLELPPEREIDLGARYPGKLLELEWRADYPIDPRGKIELEELLSPRRWQVAYAVGAVEAPAAGAYELRLGTSDPIKVWVNEVLVFAGRRLGGWRFDGVVLPLTLRKGANRILIKTAQERGSWHLVLRVTGPEGAALAGLKALPPGTAPAEGPPPTTKPLKEAEVLAHHLRGADPGAAFDDLAARTASTLDLETEAVARAEAAVAARPGSFMARLRLAQALWDNRERGRTSDLLEKLRAEGFVLVERLQARFWAQQKLEVKARELLAQVLKKQPAATGLAQDLARLYGREGWHESRCELLESLNAREPLWPDVMLDLADCHEDLRFYGKAVALYERLLDASAANGKALGGLQWRALVAGRHEASIAYARRLVELTPQRREHHRSLVEALRRAGRTEEAQAAARRLIALAPQAPTGYSRLAALARQAGDRASAVEHWKQALARNPEDQKLANRLAWLAPKQEGPYLADVPTASQIDAAIAGRGQIQPAKGTDLIYLMDDEVSVLGGDGSTINYVTMVVHAVNQAGRDRITKMNARSGRVRVLAAYAINADGRRVEASSIRGRTVRFRQLGIGSTAVLQYRVDERPDGYLSGHLARQWWFQGPSVQTQKGRWVLWAPKGTKLLQYRLGEIERSQREAEGMTRHAWQVEASPPLIYEPGAPSLQEIAAHITVSTVPGWEMFWEWEQALLQDAFRESPEVQALAKRLFAGAEDPTEKIRRIQAYLMTDIRYQQDYERFIAGVRPHAAPVVVARQYGDCKDKAVLFITLARLAGLKVHFALVRTRGAGPVRKEVPMQQFNHAIVYVPAQQGIAAGRFYDPTVDALDVDVLRADDQGTLSLVFDPEARSHTWRQIPFQAATVDRTRNDTILRVNAAGKARGEVEVTAHGRVGEAFRRGARNPEKLAQALAGQVSAIWSAGRLLAHTVLQVDDVRRPAKVRMEVEVPAYGRREGRELRLRIPVGWDFRGYFSLPQRRHPVLLGAPRSFEWRTEIELPAGAKIKRVPSSDSIAEGCLRYSREIKRGQTTVSAVQRLELHCERIDPADYAKHRLAAGRILELLDEEVVAALPRKAGKAVTASR